MTILPFRTACEVVTRTTLGAADDREVVTVIAFLSQLSRNFVPNSYHKNFRLSGYDHPTSHGTLVFPLPAMFVFHLFHCFAHYTFDMLPRATVI